MHSFHLHVKDSPLRMRFAGDDIRLRGYNKTLARFSRPEPPRRGNLTSQPPRVIASHGEHGEHGEHGNRHLARISH